METFDALVTVLAADLEPFLKLPSVRLLEAITINGGRIIRPEREAFLAVFVLDETENSTAAVKAALALRREVTAVPVTRGLRIGIATGVVTLRIDEAELPTAEGDPVDLAIRLREAVRGGGIAIDEATFDRVQNDYRFKSASGVAIKGKTQALAVHEIVEETAPTALNKTYGSMLDAMRAGANNPESWLYRPATTVRMAAEVRTRTPPIPDGLQQIVVGADRRDSATGDPVDCTVFAPPAVRGGESFLVQVFAHLPAAAGDAAQLATEFDPSATRRAFRSLQAEVIRGTRLSFELSLPGLAVDDPLQFLVWSGRSEAVQFGVTIPAQLALKVVIGTVTVSQNTVPVGHLKFRLQVLDAASAEVAVTPVPAGDSARRYNRAFISYASRDRDKVLSRVQMLKPLGIQFFQDVLDLEPGDRWEKQLYRRIDECDLFLLFWSSAARDSTWVMEEVKYALARKHDDEFAPPEIHPVIIEGPPVPAPPTELAHLHFNDRVIYFMSEAGRS